MSLTKDKILAALPALSQADLKTIYLVTSKLMGQGGVIGHPNDPTGMAGWLIEAMGTLLNRAVGDLINDKYFAKNHLIFIRWFRDTFEYGLDKKTSAMMLMRYCLNLLIEDMRGMEIPLSVKTLTGHLPRMPQVFEKAFPGYGREGAAILIEKALLGSK